MRSSLRDIAQDSLKKFSELPKDEWLRQDPAQVTLLINLCSWVINCEKSFVAYEKDKDAVKKCWEGQKDALKNLIIMV